MFAIVEFQGFQYRVEKDEEVVIPRISEAEGNSLIMERVLLLGDNGNVEVGKPTVENAKVQATVLKHGREQKLIVFKYKKRKDYRRKRGHRQQFTVVRIDDITR